MNLPRTQRMLRYLVAHPEGVRVRQVRDAVDPEAGLATVGTQMCQLVSAGKARCTGAAGNTTYFPTPLSLVDKRRVATSKAKPKTKARPKSKPVPVASKREASPPPTPPANSPARASLVRLLTPTTRRGPLTSEQIAADVAEFVRNGGRIQHLKPGESARTLSEADEVYRASRMRGRSKQQAECNKARKAELAFDDNTDDDDLADAA